MRTLGRGYTSSLWQCAGTYYYAVFASDFVKGGRVGLTLVVETTLLVVAVEDVKVVLINIVAQKDIGEEVQECGFTDTGLSNQKDGVMRLNLVLRCLDDSSLEGLYITRKHG
jgi:hypothetical protein